MNADEFLNPLNGYEWKKLEIEQWTGLCERGRPLKFNSRDRKKFSDRSLVCPVDNDAATVWSKIPRRIAIRNIRQYYLYKLYELRLKLVTVTERCQI